MERYHLHFLDRFDRVIGTALTINADTDAEAIAHAKGFVDGRDLELYQRGRLVIRLPAFYDERQKRA